MPADEATLDSVRKDLHNIQELMQKAMGLTDVDTQESMRLVKDAKMDVAKVRERINNLGYPVMQQGMLELLDRVEGYIDASLPQLDKLAEMKMKDRS